MECLVSHVFPVEKNQAAPGGGGGGGGVPPRGLNPNPRNPSTLWIRRNFLSIGAMVRCF